MEDYCRLPHLHDSISIDFMLGLMCVEILQLLNTVDDTITGLLS